MKFPITFEVYAKSKPGMSSYWDSKVKDLPAIKTCIPTDFFGPGKAYTAEDLFALAIVNCFISMFKYKTEKLGVVFKEIEIKAAAVLDRDETINKTWVSEININIKILNPSDERKAKEIIDFCVENCPISNSIKTAKIFHIEIENT